MRRVRASIVVSLLLLPFAVGAISFTDTSGSAYAPVIRELSDRGIVQGYSDGTFRPSALINRAEFLKILMESRRPGITTANALCFTDIAHPSIWYARTTCAAKDLGIVQGYSDGTFRPERAVNLVEALKMAFLTFDITPTAIPGEWFTRYLAEAERRGILLHLLSKPDHLITRGEMASIAYALIVANDTPSGPSVCGNGTVEYPEQCDDGNVKDSDGCSSICILVSEPTHRSILQIDQQPTGTVNSTAAGMQDVTLLRFTAAAGRQPALLTRLAFRADVGSLLTATKYELLVDSNADGVYELIQASAKVQGGVLSFENMLVGGINIPLNASIPFLVRGDIPQSSTSVSIKLAFATSLPGYIEAQGATDGLELEGIETDGVCSNQCFIRVNTHGGTTVDVTDRGSLFVSQDTIPARSHILLGGSTTLALLRLRLRAVSEDIDVSFIAIDGVSESIDSLRLHLLIPGENPSTLPISIASATRSQCPTVTATRVCVRLPDRTIVVSPNQERVLAFSAVLLTEQLGGQSGETATLSVSASTSASHAVEAEGVASGDTLAQNDNDATLEGEIIIGKTMVGGNTSITGSTHDTALASIGSITNDGAANSSSIPVGNQTIGRFRIAALAHNNSFGGSNRVNLTSMIFRITASNVTIDQSSFRLFNILDPSTTATCSADGTTGTITVTCSTLTGIASILDSGIFYAFGLSANVTNTEVNPGSSSLVVMLPTLGQRGIQNSITWSDEVTTFTWVDIPETSVQSTLYQR